MLVALGLESIPSDLVLGWYGEIVAAVSGINLGIEPPPAAARAVAQLAAEIATAAAEGAPPSLLRDAAEHAAGVTPEEIASNAAVLLFGGIETTEGMIATLFLDLLGHPEQLALARARPDLRANAIEESLRREPAAASVDRYATRERELGGATIRQGDLVTVSLTAANRDPATFPDPDRFEIERANARLHLAFAQGPHVCLGMHLARLEARAALDTALARLPAAPSRPVEAGVGPRPGLPQARRGAGARVNPGAAHEPLELLWARDPVVAPRHPAEEAYGSAVTFPGDRPHVFANFVQTIDGVVAFGERGGWNASRISMDSEIDRRVMALLRAQADAIVIGAGTFRTAHNHQWSPGGLVPGEAGSYDELRAELRGPGAERAPLYVITAAGDLDPRHAAFTAPETHVTVVSTASGAARLEPLLPSHAELIALGDGPAVDPQVAVRAIADRSGGLILCEGGPTLLGELARTGLLDELFLTVAPQLAGRDEDDRRLGLVEGFAASPEEAPRLELHSLRRARHHLFVRYDHGPTANA